MTLLMPHEILCDRIMLRRSPFELCFENLWKRVFIPIMSMCMEQSQYYGAIFWTYSKYCLDVL